MTIRHPYDRATFGLAYDHPANPAPGTDFVHVLPLMSRIELVAVYFTLATDANVANRLAMVRYVNGIIPNLPFWGPRFQINGTTIEYVFCNGMTREPGIAPVAGFYQNCLGTDVIVDNVTSFEIHIDGMQVGDQISNIYFWYKFWFTGQPPV
jgi:hypothetical protein